MNQVFNAHHQKSDSATKSKKSANSASPSTLSDNSLEEFLSTFDYPPPASPPTHLAGNSTTLPTTMSTITEDYTEVTLEPDDVAPTSVAPSPEQKPT